MATTLDTKWPAATSLLNSRTRLDRRNVALVGVSTYLTSLTARSSASTPQAVRAALARFSTWSFVDGVDLVDEVALVDWGDVVDPDGPSGPEAVAAALAHGRDCEMVLVLGGDNAATWLALRALAAGDYGGYGLITLDAHLDQRDGRSNGSPVRQLIDEGLDPRFVVQVGLGEFSNSAPYARRALEEGVTVVPRAAFREASAESLARKALAVAGAGGRRVYVDVDLDVVERSSVPGCPSAVPGGLSADEVRRFVREVASSNAVVALDVTEVDVERDRDERTVRLAALVVLEALLGVVRRPR